MELHMQVYLENKEKFDRFFAHSMPPDWRVFRFCSYMSTRILSNFWHCPEFKVRGLSFNSSEAAFQFLLRSADHSQAALDKWNKMQADPSKVFNRGDMKMVSKHYARGCTGIVHKLIVGAARNKARRIAGIVLVEKKRRPAEVLVEMWVEILMAKYGKGTKEREALMATRGKFLLESDTRANPSTFWAGHINEETGEERGYNFMGKMLMLVRSKIEME